MALRFQSGNTTLEVSPGLQRHVEHMLRRAAPRTMAVLQASTTSLANEARAVAPVKTGRFRAGIESVVRMVGNGIVDGVVFDRVPYAYKITVPGGTAFRSTGPMTQAQFLSASFGRDHVWTEIVRKPGMKKAPALARALAADMIATAKEG